MNGCKILHHQKDGEESQTKSWDAWWLIPLSKWVITPVINGIFVGLIHINHWGYSPLTSRGMSHQVCKPPIRHHQTPLGCEPLISKFPSRLSVGMIPTTACYDHKKNTKQRTYDPGIYIICNILYTVNIYIYIYDPDYVLSPATFDYLANLPKNIIIFECEKCSFWMVNPLKFSHFVTPWYHHGC